MTMSNERRFDIAIVGAGIAGASLAWRLAPQLSVVLLERETQPGYHSTGRSAAMFEESYGPPAVRALTRASRAFYEHPPPAFTDAPLLSPRGAMFLAAPTQQALLDTTRALLQPMCPALQLLRRDAVLARVPCLRPEAVHAALLDEGGRDIDVNALHQGFLRGLRHHGGVLLAAAALHAAARSAAGWELRLADGTALRCDRVVNAAGAWADEVAVLCGAAPVGLEPRRRSAFTFKAPDGMDTSRWPCVIGIDESWYFKPDAGQLLGSPANADPTFAHDVQPEELDIATGIARIEAVSTLQIRRPTHTWAGLRSFVRDGELVIGWDDACLGFFWLAGQGGYGIQSAAAASELAAALVLGARVSEPLARHGVDPRVLSPQRLR